MMTAQMPRLVALEPSPEYGAIIEALLDRGDFVVELVGELHQLEASLRDGQRDLCIVSFAALPRGEGDLSRLRELTEMPMMALVADGDETKAALRAGADYDLAKPFDPEHFVAAVEAVLRRASVPTAPQHLGDLAIDPESRSVERGGRRQTLSELEWRLFAYLLAHPGRVLSRRQLATGAWGEEYADRDGQAELYVSRVRRKVEVDPRRPRLIQTVRGRGYRLSASGNGNGNGNGRASRSDGGRS